MKSGELLAIGGAYVDINTSQFPIGEKGLALESEIVGRDYHIEPGGSAVNFARLCASLEIPTTFVGKIGQDEIGALLSKSLLEYRVTPLLIDSREVTTNISFNMVNKDGKSIMAVVGTANQSLTSEEVYSKASEQLATCSYLFLGGCFKLKNLMPAFIQLAQDARKAGVRIILDHARLNEDVTGEDKEIVQQLALISDLYLPSADEFMQLWNVSSLEDGLHLLSGKMSGTVIVKNSSQGAVTLIDGELVTVPAFSVNLIHTIGAGDSFNAGVIATQYHGKDLHESIKFGCATAALKISMDTLPTYDMVVDFLIHQSKK